MSTVLRPVGPHRARVYWLRRAWILGLIIVIIVVLVELLSGGSGKPSAAPNPSPSVTPTQTTTAQPTACDPSQLTLVLSTDSDTYTSGQMPKLIGELSNPSTSPCTLSRSPQNEIWTVKSGPDQVWTTKGCASSGPTKQVTIKAGGTKTLSMFWNGRRLDPNCTEGDVALAGEYTLHADLDGVTGKEAVFHITS